ncbi:MAG: aspartate/glutamate racemase family protein [Candidatus Odinarchaeota archaeon]
MRNIRVGLLGGMSYESTLKYYQLFLEKYYEKEHNYSYPEVIIFSLSFQKVIDYELGNEKEKYIQYLMEGINSLENAGVDFIFMAANSPHVVYEDLKNRANVPILSIVKATAEKAKRENMRKLLLLGIKFTMKSTFYQEEFKAYGMKVITPLDKEQYEIDKIIFDELVIGILNSESKQRLLDIISNYEVDGVILGCTELPLILKQKDTKIKLLDTIEIHIDSALDYYISL